METSRQFAFINNQHGYTISFIEGHQFIKEITKIHNIGPNALDFYKKILLGSTQLINFLKPQENLGFYIDSEEPYFRFKMEMSHNGTLRTLLLPEEFSDFPKTFTGKCRLNKITPNAAPYTSILAYENFPLEEITNEIIEKSYQTNSKVFLSPDFSNSIMLTKLPPTNINKKIDDFEELSIDQMAAQYQGLITNALNLKNSNIKVIENLFETNQFNYLGGKEIKFHCPCSFERMVDHLHSLPVAEREGLFSEEKSIDTRCDYCNTNYNIKREDMIKNLQ